MTLSPAVAIERSIADCEDVSQISAFILQPLQERFNACAASFCVINTRQDRLVNSDFALAIGSYEPLHAHYVEGMFREDPLYRGNAAVSHTLYDYLERHDADLERLKSYHDMYLMSQGIHDCMGIYFRSKGLVGDKIIAVSLGRKVGTPKFSVSDRRSLEELSTLLRLTLANASLRREAEWLWTRCQIERLDAVAHPGRDDRSLDSTPADQPGDADWADGVDATCTQFGITDREREIVRLLQKGHSNLSMAHSLKISIRTVENHLRAIYAKTFVNSRTQLLSKINTEAAKAAKISAIRSQNWADWSGGEAHRASAYGDERRVLHMPKGSASRHGLSKGHPSPTAEFAASS